MSHRAGARRKRSQAAKRSKPSAKPNEGNVTDPNPEDSTPPFESWVQSVSEAVSGSQIDQTTREQLQLSCGTLSHKSALYIPTSTAEKHPLSLSYLEQFAQHNSFKLIQERRAVDIHPSLEQRDQKTPLVTLGLSLLMKQAGVPGVARTLSKPHRLDPDAVFIDLPQLIEMAAFATPQSKRVVIPPNRILVNALSDNQAITGYACKLSTPSITTILSHFESRYLRVIGYSTANQYIAHLCVAGGPSEQPTVWCPLSILSNVELDFQLIPMENSTSGFGLFYKTFYFDMATSIPPWWLAEKIRPVPPLQHEQADSVHRKAS